jgi:drug/metabolite transporter (DMT)-like permease
MFLLGESISATEMVGALLILGSSVVLGIGPSAKARFEEGLLFVGISIICRAYYYTGIKMFVTEMGPLLAVAFLELGVGAFVIAYYLIRRRDLTIPSMRSGRNILIGSAFVIIGTTAYSYSVADIGAGITSAIIAGGPIVTALASHAMLGERLEAHKYFAIAVMAAGLIALFI